MYRFLTLLALPLLAFLTPLHGASQEAGTVTHASHSDFPPAMYMDGDRLTGVAPDLADIIFKDLGLKSLGHGGMPWGRVLRQVENGHIDMVSGLYFNSERTRIFDFVPTPLMQVPEVLFTTQNNPMSLESWDMLFGKRVTLVAHERFTPEFEQFLKDNANRITVQTAPSLNAAFQMLLAGRTDCMPYGQFAGVIKAQEFGFLSELRVLYPPLSSEGLFLAFSKHSAYRDLIPHVDQRIKARIADGTVKRLLDKHMGIIEPQ